MRTESPSVHPGLATNRVEALADGVFAIALTLLILEIKVPVLEHSQLHELPRRLLALWPKYASYLLSFMMIGIYWVAHHMQFHLIRRGDRGLLWINIAFLMTISFIPFSAALLGEYPTERIAIGVYGANLIIVGLVLYGHLVYATRNHRLVDADLDAHVVISAKRRILRAPVIYSVAILVSFFSVSASLAIFLLTPLTYIVPGKVDRWLGLR